MRILPAFIYALVMTAMMSFHTVFADDHLASFSVDSSVYSKLSEDQKNKLIQRIQEINTFIEEKVRTQIPDTLKDKTRDLKVKIILTDKPGRDGIFAPQASGEHRITIQMVQVYTNGIKALIAHEIFHAIHFVINPDEEVWVREGMAQIFEFITTGEVNGMNLSAAISDPNTPLLGKYNLEDSNSAQYGHNQLYFYYLYSHCGKDNLFWKMAAGKSSNVKGSYMIDEVLSDMHLSKSECIDFTESAINFEVAKVHNQYQFLDQKEKETYFVLPMDIAPEFEVQTSKESLQAAIKNMSVLSSFRMPLKKFTELKGECKNCALYFADKEFPFSVSEKMPSDTSTIDVILVKLKRD